MTPIARFSFVVVSSLLSSATLHAATITNWTVSTITGDVADVSTSGTADRAYNFNAAAGTVDINGVTFENVPGFASVGSQATPGSHAVSGAHTFIPLPGSESSTVIGNTTTGTLPASVTSTAYQSLLGGDIRSGGANQVDTAAPNGNAWRLTLESLSIGTTYQIQLWFNDSRSTTGNGRTGNILTGAGNVAIDYNTTNAAGGLGQYAVATFTADGTTQDIDFRASTDENVAAMLNGYQLRIVPEPSGILLAGIGMMALAGRRRRMAE